MLIAIGLVLAMGVAALLVRFGTGRVLRAGESDQDERAVRDALRLRIAGLTAALPDPGDSDSGRPGQLQRLLTEVDTAPAAQLSLLSARIEELADAATSGKRVV